jgi:uncharacterized membrane protein YesL
MGFLDELSKKRWAKEGDDRPVPQSGIARYGFLVMTHFWKLVAANLLFFVLSLPIVTLPAALTALNRVCVKLVREGNCLLWPEFRDEFRASLGSSLLLGLPYGFLIAASYYLLSLGISNAASIFGILFSMLGIFALLVCAVFGSWAFVLKSMLPLPNRDIQKNARALAIIEIRRTLAVLGIEALTVFIMLAFFPYSLSLFVLLIPALGQFTVVSLMNSRVQERVIAPFEAMQAGET